MPKPNKVHFKRQGANFNPKGHGTTACGYTLSNKSQIHKRVFFCPKLFTDDWDEVSCKRCLKFKPRKKFETLNTLILPCDCFLNEEICEDYKLSRIRLSKSRWCFNCIDGTYFQTETKYKVKPVRKPIKRINSDELVSGK